MQNLLKPFPIEKQIFERVFIKNGQIRVKRFAKDTAQSADWRDGTAVVFHVEAFDQVEIVFHFPHHGANIKILRKVRQTYSASTPSDCMDKTGFAKFKGHFR